jgi:mRNA interferase MazF
MKIKKNQIYYANLSPVRGSEQGGIRPVLILQNNVGNKMSPTVIVAAVTSKSKKTSLPTHVQIKLEDGKLPRESMAMLEQIRTIDKDRLLDYVGRVDKLTSLAIERAALVSLGIDLYTSYRRVYG